MCLAFAPLAYSQATRQKVLIVGAGSAGLSAAYHLKRLGHDITLLEASGLVGGRVARLEGLADFPIDVGAEWIHDDPAIFGEMLGQQPSDLGIETIQYQPKSYQVWSNGRLHNRNFLQHFYSETKFKSTTWFGLFERFVLPSIETDIQLGKVVTSIDVSGPQAIVRTNDGGDYRADKVILAVPLSALQKQSISFSPSLPLQTRQAIDGINFGSGFKVFLKFSERFYPDMLIDQDIWSFANSSWDSKIYYDAGFGKPFDDNVLGLFTVAQGQLARAQMTDAELLQVVLDELENIFGSRVSRQFQRGHVKNWSQMPFICGSYSMDYEDGIDPAVDFAPIANKLFFAGEYLGGDSQSTVHGAAFSGRAAAESALRG